MLFGGLFSACVDSATGLGVCGVGVVFSFRVLMWFRALMLLSVDLCFLFTCVLLIGG